MKPSKNVVLAGAISLVLGVPTVSASPLDDMPLEEQLELLQTRLWDVINSTSPESVQEFQELLVVIDQKEKELAKGGGKRKQTLSETTLVNVLPQLNQTPEQPVQEVVVKVEEKVLTEPVVEKQIVQISEQPVQEVVVKVEEKVLTQPVVEEQINLNTAPTSTVNNVEEEIKVASIEPSSSIIEEAKPNIPQTIDQLTKHIVIDKSNYTLSLYNNGELLTSQRVVVGRKGRETPSFNSEITHVVFNPYWNVSANIATVDIIPKFATNPHYALERGFQILDSWKDNAKEIDPLTVNWSNYNSRNVVPFLIRQKPGPENGVGQVKFMITSVGTHTDGIILHGSPKSEHGLFNTPVREYSSGCVRVENEVELAKLVLNHGGGYTEENIQKLIDSNATKWVKVKTPVTISIK